MSCGALGTTSRYLSEQVATLETDHARDRRRVFVALCHFAPPVPYKRAVLVEAFLSGWVYGLMGWTGGRPDVNEWPGDAAAYDRGRKVAERLLKEWKNA